MTKPIRIVLEQRSQLRPEKEDWRLVIMLTHELQKQTDQIKGETFINDVTSKSKCGGEEFVRKMQTGF